MPELDIKALCEQADVTPRTVHFYIQQGLLPPATASGPGARYTEGHLARLRLIRLLQKRHLPLSTIGRALKSLNDDQVQLLVEVGKRLPSETSDSALDYVRGVVSESKEAPWGQLLSRTDRDGAVFYDAAELSPQSLWRALEAPPGAPQAPRRSQWERYALADAFELHVQRPLSREQRRQLEKLLAAAREIFADREGEEQS
jgi:DNA-binding transcriptional MerR regulator